MRVIQTALLLSLSSLSAVAQARLAPVKGPVEVVPQRPIGKGIAAFPRIKSNAAVSPAVAATINASLSRLDKKVHGAAAECAKEFQESTGNRSVDGWQRTVTVTMKGPSYLSVQASDSVFCGGAHPSESFLPMVYDLKTGRPVNWKTLLPADAESSTSTTDDDVTVGVITWTPLLQRAAKRASGECRSIFEGSDAPKQFVLSLDGREGTLAGTAVDLPHVAAACAQPVGISAEDAKKLDVSSAVTDALIAARKLQ